MERSIFTSFPLGTGRRTSPGLLLVAFFVASWVVPPVVAQRDAPLANALACAGVTTESPLSGEPWVYLLVQPTRLDLAAGSAFAIYRKTGSADASTPFISLGVIGRTADDRVIRALQPRAANVGGSLEDLDNSLTGMFRGLVASDDLSTAEKLASVILGTTGRPEHQATVFLLVRRHPLAAMAMGLAHASPLPSPGIFTFEIREFDLASEQDMRVIGRVTVDSENPQVLPAPGPPLQLLAGDARDHLNVQLRWSTPADLRRASLLHYGYDVLRIPQAVAESHGISPASPSLTQLLELVNDGNPATGLRANRHPILPRHLYDESDVANPADDTAFIIDDNRRQDPPQTSFANGDSFYYFVVARDLLGQPGLPSPGRLVTVCDRYRPSAPFRIAVDEHTRFDETTGIEIRGLDVSWLPSEDPHSGVAQYYVYRWERPQDVHVSAVDPLINRIGTVAHDSETRVYHFIDSDSEVVDQPGRTFFYTVRTLDQGACGGNLSVNSGPVPGTLRDHSAPASPSGAVEITCYAPEVTFDQYTLTSHSGASIVDPPVEFFCRVEADEPYGSQLAWAEFAVEGQVWLGRAFFRREPDGSYLARLRSSATKATPSCRVGTRSGIVSALVTADAPLPQHQPDTLTNVFFSAALEARQTETGNGCDDGHALHDPDTGETNPVCVIVDTPPGATEYRIYRQIDGEEATLVDLGSADPAGGNLTFKDSALPSGSSACYYLQAVDRDGNVSPRVAVGDCVRTLSPSRLPVPVLQSPEALGSAADPGMRVTWHCSPHTVRRFELWIAMASSAVPSPIDRDRMAEVMTLRPNELPDHTGLDFHVFETSRLESLEDPENGIFSFDLSVVPGEVHTLLVRAAGDGDYDHRVTGAFSNVQTFTWIAEPSPPGPEVPWPARGWPHPQPVTQFHPSVGAQQLFDLPQWQGAIGIRIGEYRYNGSKYLQPSQPGPNGGIIHTLGGDADPHAFLYRSDALTGEEDARTDGSLFPCVLYRYRLRDGQTTDVVQVSPLMESMAYGYGTDPVEGTITHIYDPFIAAAPKAEVQPEGEPNYDLFLLDRSPVIAGERYRYVLVRFAADGEMRRIYTLDTSPIEP